MSELLDKLMEDCPEWIDIYTDKTFDTLDRIYFVMREKELTFGDLAEYMGESEEEIKDLLTGSQNFDIRTISKLEDALGESIINIEKPRI